MSLTTINPATGNILSHYAYLATNEIKTIIQQTHIAYTIWEKFEIEDRAKCFIQATKILAVNKEKYARLITAEMGKPLKSAGEEIEKCIWVCNHFSEKSAEYLAPRIVKTEMKKSYIAYRPLGTILAIMPWNFPFWQVFRFAAPALMAGNSALLKHAPITTGCGLEIEALFRQAGFPENIFRALVIDNNMTEQVIHHPYISAVTLTGSNQTGKIVGAIAGSALKKIVLELGGSDAYIILEDADLDAAAEAVLTSRMNNAGQSCIAAKRILAVQPIRKQVQKILLDKLKRYQFGDPMDPAIQIGPLAREDLRAHLHEQVRTSVNQGAKILVGGIVPKGPGFYYPPTVLVEVKKGMPAYDEELFGPVITFIDAANEQEAVAIANGSQFGLSASIFTQNQKHGEAIALNALQAGTVFVNAFVRSDPRLPFGGIKGSGFGRELACEGIHEFVNIKTIGIA